MPNGLGTLRLLLGALHGGWCVHPVNLLSQPDQMRYVLDHADGRLALVAPEWADRVRGLMSTIARPIPVVVADPDTGRFGDGAGVGAGRIDADSAAARPAPETLALLMYTSGTTGKPKGVMLSQANLAASAAAISAEHRLGPADRVLAVLPLYHINAFAVTMLAPLAHGGSLVMPPRFSPGAFWRQAIRHRCTWINVVPTMISYLLSVKAPLPEAIAGIRFCRSASSALPPSHHREFEARFGIGIIETMGLTETAAPSFSNPPDPSARRIGSVGRASGCDARIADPAGNTLPDGATGELLIRGPQVMSGYYKDPEATRAAFHPGGWLRTGDLGHRDTDGFFFVTGRIKELIIKGGENIAPREIDEALLKHPAVLDAAAFGLPDAHYGQVVAAAVIPRDNRPEAELREALLAHCEVQLGPFKTPREIAFVAELPRGPSGKVQRLKLAAALATGLATGGPRPADR